MSTFLSDAVRTPISNARTEERMAFLKKTYSLVLIGVGVFGLTISMAQTVEPLMKMATGLWDIHFLLFIALVMGIGCFARVTARKRGIGLMAYILYAFVLGLMLTIPVSWATGDIATTAAVMTGIIFLGLTAYVFVTKKDFSFLGGILSIGIFSLIGIALCGWLFGFNVGIWYCWFGAAIYSGFILYDTSKIMKTHSYDEALPAAIELFTDIVMLFWYLLMICMSSRD